MKLTWSEEMKDPRQMVVQIVEQRPDCAHGDPLFDYRIFEM